MTIFLALLAAVGVIGIAVAILIAYRFGYRLGKQITDDSINRLSKTTEENIALKEKLIVTSEIINKWYKHSGNVILEKAKENEIEIKEFEDQAMKEAFGEYGYMFKDDIKGTKAKAKTQEFGKDNAK